MTNPTSPLWHKGGDVDAAAQAFCAADDVLLDVELLPYDVQATRAHVRGLARIGVLSAAEVHALVAALDQLAADVAGGAFVLDGRYEDGHTAIEARLTERLGDVGKKVHTGRSRNDQVLVALRLWTKDALSSLKALCEGAAGACIRRGRATIAVPMPGYTHLQRAVPSSLGALFLGHAEGFLEDAESARAARARIDASPLGTAAGYGVNLPLDRAGVAGELGFARLVVSPIAAQNSRGKLELYAVQALHQALLDVRRLAWDLSLFTTAEFAFAKLPDAYTTGSSIMPNKKNPDVVELLRALPSSAEGAMAELSSLLSLPSGYHRDLQGTKGPLFRAFRRGLQGLALVPALVEKTVFDEAAMRAAIDATMHATDRAVELAAAGTPFREAYQQAAAELHQSPAFGGTRTPEGSLAARVSPGAPGAPMIEELELRLAALTTEPG